MLTFREDDCGRGTRKGDNIRGTSADMGLNRYNIILIQRVTGVVKDFVNKRKYLIVDPFLIFKPV